MAARIYPADAVAGAPAYAGRALRQVAVAPFVALGAPARALGGLSGVRPGTPSTIGSVTTTTWTVQPFAGVLDGEALAIAGPYTYAFDTAQTGSINAQTSTARTDRLDVQINDSAESDGTPTTTPAFAQIIYTPATVAGVTPAAPPRTHPLFLINVPVTGGGAPTLTWNASFTAAAGAFADFLTYSALQAWTTAPPGQHATVFADPIATNNGEYIASASGWLPSGGAAVPHFTYLKSGTFNWSTVPTDHTWDSTPNEGVLSGFTTTDHITFTCTIPGLYRLQGQITTDTTAATSTDILLLKGGTTYRQTNGLSSTVAYVSQDFDFEVRFAAGDTFKFQIQAGAAVAGVHGNQSFLTVDLKQL